METIFKYLLTLVSVLFMTETALGEDYPIIDPVAIINAEDGTVTEIHPGENYQGSAPLSVTFNANPQDADDWTANYEWRFYRDTERESPYLIRYEENTSFTFTEAGTHRIVCYTIFTRGEERIEYTQEYWTQEIQPIQISISESKLEMPNTFSPNNGDEINNIYRAKSGYQSLVEFKASIFNRWGQKLYEWTDPAGGWDGTYHGKDVAQGTYFVVVTAKGADGRRFNIRKDVNLLRGHK